jgi:hypothetical protein
VAVIDGSRRHSSGQVVPVIPRHVAACQHSPTELERWFIYTWRRDGSSPVQVRVPYCCDSWRCAVCRRHEAAVTFARLKEAQDSELRAKRGLEPLDPRGWVMLVLTLDRDGYFSGQPWHDVNAAYAALGKMTRAVLGRIGRVWGPDTKLERSGRSRELRTVRTLGNRWISVVEAHRSGWPHANVFVWCPELADELRREQAERLEDPELADAVALARDAWKAGEPVPAAVRERARRASLIGGELAELVTASGWGLQSTAEAARDIEAVLAYGVKLCGLHEASVGELAKITQAPLNAPVRFRRLRSGKGFLPPRHSNPDVTGCLVRRRRSAEGDWDIQAVNAPKDETQVEAVLTARRAELALIAEEESILSRNRGRLPVMPPVRIVIGGQLEGHKQTSERRAALQSREMAAAG